MRLWLTRVCNLESIKYLWLRYAAAIRLAMFCLLAPAIFPSLTPAQAPVFVISPEHSSIKFHVKASVNIAGKFRQAGCSSNIYIR
jgi:hypothetical protein